MERFGYNPPPTLNAPELPGLVVHEVDLEHIKAIREMNEVIFKEQRIINSFEREDLMILEASLDGKPVGFKVGYRENSKIFYSAKTHRLNSVYLNEFSVIGHGAIIIL